MAILCPVKTIPLASLLVPFPYDAGNCMDISPRWSFEGLHRRVFTGLPASGRTASKERKFYARLKGHPVISFVFSPDKHPPKLAVRPKAGESLVKTCCCGPSKVRTCRRAKRSIRSVSPVCVTPGFISKRYIAEFVMDIHAATRYI